MGERWAYRARLKELGSAVRQVEIVRVGGSGRSGWIHVRFLEGDEAGLQDTASSRTSSRSAQPSWYSSRRDDRKLDAEVAVLRTVRAWCGEDKAERYDELVALRAEATRLG